MHALHSSVPRSSQAGPALVLSFCIWPDWRLSHALAVQCTFVHVLQRQISKCLLLQVTW